MTKKIIVALAILILAGGGIWYFFNRPTNQKLIAPEVILPEEESQTKEAQATSGVGWSVMSNEEEAVDDAVNMLKQSLAEDPDFAFVYCASGYEEEKILQEVNRLLPETKIIGGNSGYGIMNPDGYFWYPVAEQSIGILGVAADDITWGVGSAVVAEGTTSREAAKQATLAAISDAGQSVARTPSLVINVPSFDMDHNNVLKGIADVFGESIPVFGAYSVDRGIAGDWRVFANNSIFHDGVAVAVVYTDLAIGIAREHGFEVTEKGGVVTKVEGNKLIEIDGKPAAEVYNDLTGGLFSEEIKDPTQADVSKTRIKSSLNPLAKVIRESNDEIFYVPALLIKILPDLSMTLDSLLEEGDELMVLRTDWEIFLNRLRTTPAKAIANAGTSKEDILFALDSFCCATHYSIPATERPKSPQILKEAVGNAPFLVICACGIQAPEPSVGNIYTSLGNGTLIFSAK